MVLFSNDVKNIGRLDGHLGVVEGKRCRLKCLVEWECGGDNLQTDYIDRRRANSQFHHELNRALNPNITVDESVFTRYIYIERVVEALFEFVG